MNKYLPDGWVIIKLNDTDYRVYGTWNGGYVDSDHWRVNSGCTKAMFNDQLRYYEVNGNSGSTYFLYLNRYDKFSSWYLRSTLEDICKMNNAVVLSAEETIQFLESIKTT